MERRNVCCSLWYEGAPCTCVCVLTRVGWEIGWTEVSTVGQRRGKGKRKEKERKEKDGNDMKRNEKERKERKMKKKKMRKRGNR